MTNKLAGQRAKFSRARAAFYTTADERQRTRAARLMAEVLTEAPEHGFAQELVTQGEDVPDEVRVLVEAATGGRMPRPEAVEERLSHLEDVVDSSDLVEIGVGAEHVYAYGYACAPDRVKIGSAVGDVQARVAAQIGTGTPDKPSLKLIIRTRDCRALERVLHGLLRLKRRKVDGAGAEWFVATRDEVVALHATIAG